jgi:hypothetical protein
MGVIGSWVQLSARLTKRPLLTMEDSSFTYIAQVTPSVAVTKVTSGRDSNGQAEAGTSLVMKGSAVRVRASASVFMRVCGLPELVSRA